MNFSRSLKISVYITLWISYFLLQYYFLSYPFNTQAAFILAARIVLIHAILFYVNSYLLLPKLLDRNHYVLYFLSVLILLIITYALFVFSHELNIVREAFETGRFRRPRNILNIERAFRTRIFINNLISSLAVLFISTTYWIIQREQKRKQQEIKLINENLQTEMKFLKSQVNPHFLLNALNNIYSLAHIRSSKTADMILRLAGMLKYMLYGANAKNVTLGQEISYIEDYIAFQKLKFEHAPRILADFREANRDLYLAPMLLMPFIENSFKHSDLEDRKDGFVTIKLTTFEHIVHLKVENSVILGSRGKEQGGIGLQNVRRRLKLLYPNKHELKIARKEGEFMVELILKTS